MQVRLGDAGSIRSLQERVARALPADQVERVGGWWLRYAPGCSWWVGTVLPHGGGNRQRLAELVERVEEFYASRGVPARLQISPPACPDELDELLAGRGYRTESPMALLTVHDCRLRVPAELDGGQVQIDETLTPEWFDAWSVVHGHTGEARAEWAMLERVTRPCAYASVRVSGEIVAVGRAVTDTGWTGVFGMATRPEARGRGHAGVVLAALAGWARSRRVERMFLQVEQDNGPATRLYRRAGFTELCRYHYRTATRGSHVRAL